MAGVCTDPGEEINPPVMNKLCHCGSFYLPWLWEEMGREEIEASEQGWRYTNYLVIFLLLPA